MGIVWDGLERQREETREKAELIDDDGAERGPFERTGSWTVISWMPRKRIEIAMTCPNRLLRPLVLLTALVCLTPGCGRSAAPVVDSQPFEAAVARYLDQNNMGVALKDIKAGPTIEGNTTTLTASLHHATMGGPAVTWTFRFEQDADGTWKAVSHQ